MPYLLTLVFSLSMLVPLAAQSALPAAFESFLESMDRAQIQLQNGEPTAFKGLWSQRDDVTLAGGFGGPVAKGWQQVSARLDAPARQFSNGRHHASRVVATVGGDLGYLVQTEHIDYREPGQTTDAGRDYRVTMIFRREAAGWRIVHRHADTQLTNQMTR
jgi:ketosteroid isomerase-like protein